MEKIFEIATKISTPLALSGLIATICFFLLKQIISMNVYPKLTKQLSTDIIHSIINKLFILSLISLFLGFSGWVYGKILETNANKNKIYTIEGTVFVDNKEYKGAVIKILEIEKMDETNSYGKFRFIIDQIVMANYDSLTFTISLDKLKIDTLFIKKKDEYQNNLNFKLKKSKGTSNQKQIQIPYNLVEKIERAENYYKTGSISGRNSAVEIYNQVSKSLTIAQKSSLSSFQLIKEADNDYNNQRYDNALLKYYQAFHPFIKK